MPSLDWIGKKAVVNHHRQVPYRLIHCDKDKSFGDPEAGNLLVQGDNLEALKALLPYYAGKVKCIYIDPPYNTGNESWVYNDNVNSPEMRDWLGKVVGKEAEDLSRHDKWLCMMYPRLRLLKEFLSEDGSIWISIDDNEVHGLKLVCDEIFGRNCFVTNVVWRSTDNSNNDSKTFSIDYNSTLVYSRNKEWLSNRIFENEAKQSHFNNPDNDPRGPWFDGNPISSPKPRPNLKFEILGPHGNIIKSPRNGWRWKRETLESKMITGEIRFNRTGTNILRRTYLEDMKGLPPSNLWIDLEETGHNRQAKYEQKILFPNIDVENLFETPKPEKLISKILSVSTNKNDYVLDSFSGSGTCGAVAQKMGRRWLMIEMEPRSIGFSLPRLQKVFSGEDLGGISESVGWQGGSGFRYCTLGEPLFDADGNVNAAVSFPDLAAHVFFCETGSPIPKRADPASPLIGTFQGRAIYLLHNADAVGVASDNAGNVLTGARLDTLSLPEPGFSGARIVYGEGCTVPDDRLARLGVTFKQIPYQIEGL